MKSKPEISIVRAIDVRVTQAEFAKSFKKLDPIFISSGADAEVKDYARKIQLKHIDLTPYAPLGIDPVKILLGKRTHQSWLAPLDLEKFCINSNILEIYELYYFYSGETARVAHKLGIPLVCEVWTNINHPGYFLPPYSFNTRKVFNTASLFVARNKKAFKSLVELGVSERKIKMIYHGVNLERFHPRKRRDGRTLNILFIGKLEPYKGVAMLLDIWPEVLKNFPNSELLLAGSGSLARKAAETKRVKVLGYVKHLDLPHIYQGADIFVAPSKDRFLGPFLWSAEFFSHVLMEAQATGLPIVATNCGGIPEEVGDGNFLVPQRDPKALYRALVDLIKSPAQRAEIGQKNRERAEKFYDLNINTRQFETEVLELIKKW